MPGWVKRWILNALALLLTATVIEGIQLRGLLSAFVAAAVLGIVNVVIRPVLIFFTLPINIVTLGLFTFVINGFMLKIVAAVVRGFDVEGFWAAIVGAVILSLVSWGINLLVPHGRRRW